MVGALNLIMQTSLNPLDTDDSHLRPSRTAADETPVPSCSAQPIVDFNHFLSAQVAGKSIISKMPTQEPRTLRSRMW